MLLVIILLVVCEHRLSAKGWLYRLQNSGACVNHEFGSINQVAVFSRRVLICVSFEVRARLFRAILSGSQLARVPFALHPSSIIDNMVQVLKLQWIFIYRVKKPLSVSLLLVRTFVNFHALTYSTAFAELFEARVVQKHVCNG